MARPSPEEREQLALEAAQQAARQIRRFFETGREKAELDSDLVPLIYKLAPSTKIIEKDEVEYSRKWEKNKGAFKAAVKDFRGRALKAGFAVPRETDKLVRYQHGGTVRSTSESSSTAPDGNTEDVEMAGMAKQNSPPALNTAANYQDSASPTPEPSSMNPPSDTGSSSNTAESTQVPSVSAQAPPRRDDIDSTTAPPSSRNPSSAPSNTPAPSTRDLTAPPQPSVETPPREQSNNLPKDIWPRFTALMPDPKSSPGWRALQQECLLYGCDFADVKFRCEFRLKHEAKDNADGLRAFAADWIRICPEALDLLEGDCHGDSTMKNHIVAYRSRNPRKVPQRNQRDSGSRSRLFSEDPEQDRQQRGFKSQLKEPYDGWDDIKFEEDPDDPKKGEVIGKMKLAIAGWLDVALPSLNDEHPDKERHILVRESDYPEAATRFSQVTIGDRSTFKNAADKSLLRNKKRSDFKVVSYSSAKQERDDLWPRTYTTAYLDNGDNNSSLNIWARTSWHYFGKSTIDKEINDSREEVGQERVSIAK